MASFSSGKRHQPGDAYESLPLHLEPLPETEPPPPPGWASTGRGGGGAPISQQNDAQRPALQRASTLPPGAEPSERHLAWFRRLESSTTKELLGNFEASSSKIAMKVVVFSIDL